MLSGIAERTQKQGSAKAVSGGRESDVGALFLTSIMEY
jgi:hypothetical protein